MITHITDGFTFLGQTFRKTGNVLRITPAKKGVLALKEKLSELIRKHVGGPLEPLINVNYNSRRTTIKIPEI